jgi:hypothetical protein
VLGLTAGDYLLWNWSLSGNHDVPALISGLTLPPLAAASMLLIATTALRLLARSTRRFGAGNATVEAHPEPSVGRVTASLGRPDAPPLTADYKEWGAPVPGDKEAQRAASVGDQRRPSRKLAA